MVKATCGSEAAERVNQAFTVAATALASGVDVSVWLTGEAAWLATPGAAEALDLPGSAGMASLRDAVLAGGTLTVCGQCAHRRDLTVEDLVPGAQIRGAAAFVEEVMAPRVQALVY